MKQHHKDAIVVAVVEAEKKTSASIVTIVMPESNVLRETTLLAGLLLGTVLALVLWRFYAQTSLPGLLAAQLLVTALVAFVPWVRHIILKLLPKRLVHHHAARSAYEQYVTVTHALPASKPVVLLYISLAERYVHIIASHQVREKISYDHLNKVVVKFTAGMKSEGLQKSTTAAIESLGDLLAAHFPPR